MGYWSTAIATSALMLPVLPLGASVGGIASLHPSSNEAPLQAKLGNKETIAAKQTQIKEWNSLTVKRSTRSPHHTEHVQLRFM